MKRMMAAITLAAIAFCSVPVYANDTANTSNTVTQTYEIDVRDGASVEKSDLFEKEKKAENGNLVLKDVEYKVVKEEPIYREGTVEKSVTKVSDQADYKADNTITEDGITYTLKKTKLQSTKTVQEENTQTVTKTSDYEVYTTRADAPGSVTVNTVNEVTGESIDVECTLQSFDEIQGQTVSVPIVYTNYDSDYYIYNGGEVSRNDAYPALSGYEDAILADAGLDGRNATITGITWSGEPYTDANGELARNAPASVAVTNYRATYTGSINTPKKEEYTYLLTYEGQGEQEVSGIKHVTVEATATYELVENAPTIPVAVIVGIAVAILALLIVLILFVLAKKRKKKEEKYQKRG